MKIKKTHHKGRTIALQILYELEYIKITIDSAIANYKNNYVFSDEILNFTIILLNSVNTNLKKIDFFIEKTSNNWKIERMSYIDRNILRLACTELFFLDNKTSYKIIINEAIELAKKFSSKKSFSFINAILDNLFTNLKNNKINLK